MLKSRLQFRNHKGFTLVELVLGVSLMSMLLITFLSFLNFILKVNERDILKDEILLNGRYVTEYIKEDISSADKIIASSLFAGLDKEFPKNMGFVILKVDREVYKAREEDEYSYTTYYFRDDKIVRINAKKIIKKKREYLTEDLLNDISRKMKFAGHNTMAYYILEESEITLGKDNIVHLNLFLKDEKTEVSNFKSKVFLRCEVLR